MSFDLVATRAPLPHRLVRYLQDISTVLSWRAARALGVTLLLTLSEGIGLFLLLPLLQITGLEVGPGPADQAAGFVTRVFSALHLPMSLSAVLFAYMLVVSVNALLGRFEAINTFALQQYLVTHLRRRLYKAITRADWLFFVRSRSSNFMHALTRELESVEAATSTLFSWLVDFMVTGVYIAFALWLYPLMTCVVLASGSVLLLLRSRVNRAQEQGEALSEAYEKLYADMSDHFAGMKTAKGHGVEAAYLEQFSQTSGEVECAHTRLVETDAAVTAWSQVATTGVLAVIVYVALGTLNLTPADILLLLFLFYRLIPMISDLQSSYGAFLGDLPAYDNVRTLESRCLEAAEPAGASPSLPDLRHTLTLQNVSFRYSSGSEHPTLDGLNLTIEVGKTTALVGPSGAGKSTVADLAVGLLSPESGQLLLDGQPLAKEALGAWRQRVGYVAQDTFLFHDSVRANLRVTKPDASEAELLRALEEAAALDFVRALPRGLDTLLGDRGVRLSGGERQRLALARALLRRPALLVLDEATSSLDAENEGRVQGAIDGLRGHMTLLVIAHRLSTVRHADRIYVLEQGRVVESGDWETLLRTPAGRFRSLCLAQGLLAPQLVAAGSDSAAIRRR